MKLVNIMIEMNDWHMCCLDFMNGGCDEISYALYDVSLHLKCWELKVLMGYFNSFSGYIICKNIDKCLVVQNFY